MARIRLRRPDQPWGLRLLLGLFEFLASLELAVALLTTLCVVLGYGTFVEKYYGTRGVHFGVYQTWWFLALGALLAVNIFCAAAIRFPWKKYQTGFVITHLGLLVLLFGCLLKNRWGIDAQMPLFEGTTNRYALEDQSTLELTIVPHTADSSGHGTMKVLEIPLRTGPFNWQDFGTRLGWFPWRLAHRDQGLLRHPALDQENIRVEVLDFYADCEEIATPAVELRISTPPRQVVDPETGKTKTETVPEDRWMPVMLQVRAGSPHAQARDRGVPDRRRVGGGTITFWLAPTREETQAFLQCRPPEKAEQYGSRGVVVLWANGKTYTLRVDQLEQNQPRKLGEQLQVTLRNWTDAVGGMHQDLGAALMLEVVQGEQRSSLSLFENYPERNVQDFRNHVYGYYFVRREKVDTRRLMQGRGGSRLDIIQGVDSQGKPALFYRYWNRKQLAFVGPLPADGTLADAFRMPIGQLKLKVTGYFPALEPGFVLRPRPFDKQLAASAANRAIRLRVTLDGRSEEFWLTGPPFDPLGEPPRSSRRTIQGRGRTLMVRLPLKRVDVGVLVRLKRFQRKQEPGTQRAIAYESTVDFLDPDTKQVLRENVRISMNEPVDYQPKGARNSGLLSSWFFTGYYRFFQESFSGPFLPGDPTYEAFYRRHPELADQRRERLYLSTLTVNYDPGRGWVYLGCWLVVSGIFTMFYMRAYFFRPRRRVAREASSAPQKTGKRRRKSSQPAAAGSAVGGEVSGDAS